mmetsp:Transcript_13192/g.23636  ORF Transcript_13192/g.23636 Transcript_13192/m.23636 type:complete len:82 (+) Transcript_13192:4096-4341(+)
MCKGDRVGRCRKRTVQKGLDSAVFVTASWTSLDGWNHSWVHQLPMIHSTSVNLCKIQRGAGNPQGVRLRDVHCQTFSSPDE